MALGAGFRHVVLGLPAPYPDGVGPYERPVINEYNTVGNKIAPPFTSIVKYDLNGKYLYGWGGPGGQPGQFNGPHSITTDQDGNLYLAEVFNGRVQKFRPKPGADRAKMVGPEHRYGTSSSN